MSTSSDSGDEYKNLKEAIDPDFLSNNLFRMKDESRELIKPVKLPISLRKISDASNNFNPLEIKVTPEFKAYVSKHLKKKLSKLIDDTQELPENNRKKFIKKNKAGNIKLLRTSRNFINVSDKESPVTPVKKHKKVKRRKLNDNSSNSGDSDEEKAKEVAVTAEWILSGKATEGWAINTKGELEIISVPVSKD